MPRFSDTHQNEHTLSNIDILSGISAEERNALEKHCQWQTFGSDEKVIQKGETYSGVYFLAEGQVRVLNFSEAGRAISYATLGSGDFFGELSALDGLPRSAWVWTTRPCTVATLSGPAFRDLVTNSPALSLALLQKMASVIRMADDRIADLGLLSVDQRVCIELMRMAQPDPATQGTAHKGLLVPSLPTHASLASVVGASRETISRVFGHLRQEEIVRRDGRTLYIRDKRKLEQRAFP